VFQRVRSKGICTSLLDFVCVARQRAQQKSFPSRCCKTLITCLEVLGAICLAAKPWYDYATAFTYSTAFSNEQNSTRSAHTSNSFPLQEASFKEFLSRPENQTLVEKHQRREVKQAIQLQEKTAALRFRDKVLESDYESQTAIAPFLRNRVLRRVIQTFANDPNGDFDKWATNPRVIDMLREAQRMMNEGRLAEDEAEEYMLRALKDPQGEHHAEFAAKTRQVARLPTDQLVEALNEHVGRCIVTITMIQRYVL
jgi:hypothetical protein